MPGRGIALYTRSYVSDESQKGSVFDFLCIFASAFMRFYMVFDPFCRVTFSGYFQLDDMAHD